MRIPPAPPPFVFAMSAISGLFAALATDWTAGLAVYFGLLTIAAIVSNARSQDSERPS